MVKHDVVEKIITLNVNSVIRLCEETFTSIKKQDWHPKCEKL